jgi:hypothetical protein
MRRYFLLAGLIGALSGCMTLPAERIPQEGETSAFPSPQPVSTPLGIVPDVKAVTYYTNGNLAAVHFAGPKEYSHLAGGRPSLTLPVTSLWFYASGEVKKAELSGTVSLEFRNEPMMFLQLVNGKQAAGLMWFYKSGFIREINFSEYTPVSLNNRNIRIQKLVCNDVPLEGRDRVKLIEVDEGTTWISDGQVYTFSRGDIINISDGLYWGKYRWDEEKEGYTEIR